MQEFSHHFRDVLTGDKLVHWHANSNDTIYRGNKDPYEALFLFMSNFPWREDLPCAGTFIFKPNAASIAILQEWWDYDIPQKNVFDFMEQVRDVLWTVCSVEVFSVSGDCYMKHVFVGFFMYSNLYQVYSPP